VLPGESLAKYSRANIQPLDEEEAEEIRSLQESSEAPAAETASEAAEVEEPPIPEIEAEPGQPESSGEAVAQPRGEPKPVTDGGGTPAEEWDRERAAEAAAGSDAAPAAEIEPAGAAEEPPAAEEPQPGAPAPELTAQVREQGGRYMHRIPRRMRRKMR